MMFYKKAVLAVAGFILQKLHRGGTLFKLVCWRGEGEEAVNMAAQPEAGPHPRLSVTFPKVSSSSQQPQVDLEDLAAMSGPVRVWNISRGVWSTNSVSSHPPHICGHSDFRKQQTVKFQDPYVKVLGSQTPPTVSFQRIAARDQLSSVSLVFGLHGLLWGRRRWVCVEWGCTRGLGVGEQRLDMEKMSLNGEHGFHDYKPRPVT